jgi:hypothetical protein
MTAIPLLRLDAEKNKEGIRFMMHPKHNQMARLGFVLALSGLPQPSFPDSPRPLLHYSNQNFRNSCALDRFLAQHRPWGVDSKLAGIPT